MVAVIKRIQGVLRQRHVDASAVAAGLPLRMRATPVIPPEPGVAPTADFSVVANSQLVAALLGDF